MNTEIYEYRDLLMIFIITVITLTSIKILLTDIAFQNFRRNTVENILIFRNVLSFKISKCCSNKFNLKYVTFT